MFSKSYRFFSSALSPFILLPWVMVIVLVGTIEQKRIGLYAAQYSYFDTFMIILAGVPLPGLGALISMLGLSLVFKLLRFRTLSFRQAPSTITHLSVFLLVGSLTLGHLNSQSGFLIVDKESFSGEFSEYYTRELVVFSGDTLVFKTDLMDLDEGGEYHVVDGMTLAIDTKCAHCTLTPRRYVQASHKGQSALYELTPETRLQELEKEVSALSFYHKELGYHYIAVEGARTFPSLTVGEREYTVIVRKRMHTLPFSISLISLEQSHYAGTRKAEGYRSDLIIKEGELEYPVSVSMNAPIRYQGYSIFQSGVVEREGNTLSELNIVENPYRLWAYYATALLFLGLVWQALSVFFRQLKNGYSCAQFS